MEHAIAVFSNRMVPFVYGDHETILFALGENADPHIGGLETRTDDGMLYTLTAGGTSVTA
jgi:hypothetical protein